MFCVMIDHERPNHALLVFVVIKLWLNFDKVKLFTISSCSRDSWKGSKFRRCVRATNAA